MSAFKKAERRQAKLKLAITGPSGGGKTFSALRLAAGLGGKIAVIDTENGSASLYADRFDFEVLEIHPPYTIQKYQEALRSAAAEGFNVVIVDSITHAWAGDGGLLSKKEALDARGGNSYTNWAGITKEHEAFKGTILSSPFHLICTMRSKQDYVLETNDKGKQAPRKVGLAPIQRDGMEYEFTTVFDVAMDHNAQASKDRTSLFDGQLFTITEDTGKALVKWLNGAKADELPPQKAEEPAKKGRKKPESPAEEPKKPAPTVNLGAAPDLQAKIFTTAKKKLWSTDQVKDYMRDVFRADSTAKLSKAQCEEFISDMEAGSFEAAFSRRLDIEAGQSKEA